MGDGINVALCFGELVYRRAEALDVGEVGHNARQRKFAEDVAVNPKETPAPRRFQRIGVLCKGVYPLCR